MHKHFFSYGVWCMVYGVCVRERYIGQWLPLCHVHCCIRIAHWEQNGRVFIWMLHSMNVITYRQPYECNELEML